MKRSESDGRVKTVRTWAGRLTLASLALATTLAWNAPVSAGIVLGTPSKRVFHDADGNLAFKSDEIEIDWSRTAATAKDGGKPERVVWGNGSYPYALLSESDRAFVDAELAQYAEERARLEFYDADGNIAFEGLVDLGLTAATAKDGGKPELVFWRKTNDDSGRWLAETSDKPFYDGSYPYAQLSEEDRAFVDAELARYAAETTKETEKRARLEFYDANGNLAFTGRVVYGKTSATAKDGGKPERVFWHRFTGRLILLDKGEEEPRPDGSYPYALLSEDDRAFVDAALAEYAEEAPRRAEEAKRDAEQRAKDDEGNEKERKENRARLQFYDANGNLVFTGRVDGEATLATVKEGSEKPERVVWSYENWNAASGKDSRTTDGSYPYSLLGEDDRARVDAELARFAERMAALEKVKKTAVEMKASWEKEAPQTPEVKRVEGRKIAVLIGCGKFDDESISNLRYPVADAKLLAERLGELGFSENAVVVLTDEEATRAQIYKLVEILANFSKPGDMIFVALNGQGFERGGETYWVPTDAKADDLISTSVSLNDFTEKLEAATPGRAKIVFFDACRKPLKKDENDKAEATDVKALPVGDVWALYACGANGLAFENDAIQHGLFSYAFAEGLTEKGDANGDGVVTAMEAFFYAKAQTTATINRKFEAEQTPVVVGPFADVEMGDLKADTAKKKSDADGEAAEKRNASK